MHAADIDEARDKLGHNVTISISNVTIHGHPATGKTSVINLAMGRPPPVNHHSTGVAEPPSCSIIVGDVSSEDAKWEDFDSGKMFEMVCETINAALVEPKSVIVDHVSTEPDAVPQLKTEPTPSDPLSPRSVSPSHPSPTPSQSSPRSSPPSPPSLPSSSLPSRSSPPAGDTLTAKPKQDFPQILNKILQRLHEISGSSSSLFHAKLILMSDSGGQPNYLDVFPLFVRNKCLAIFTLKLNERLDYTPQFSYCIEGHPISMADTKLQYSHQQLLESLAKSMSSFLPSLSPSPLNSHGDAGFTVIGTFADRKNECKDESLEDKNTSINQSLQAYKKLQKHETILPINAISCNEQRNEYMMTLRRRISKAPSIEVDIKLRWFAFYLSLLSEADTQQSAILTRQKCLEIGRSHEMDEQETRKATAFFHKLNLILHYQTKKLDNFVIIKLEPIFELVSRLIGVSFFNKEELDKFFNIDLSPCVREQFQQQGYLVQQTLEEIFKSVDSESKLFVKNVQFPGSKDFGAVAFIDLLAEVKAVAIIKSEPRSVFMPCVLRYASKEEEGKIMKKLFLNNGKNYPWIVRLKCGGSHKFYVPLPPGFSPTLVVLLLSSDSFSIEDSCQQYRNIFVLHYTNGGDVAIIERQLQLEVYYSFNDRECYAIRSHIRKTILETENRLSFDVVNIDIEDSFLCSCHPRKESRHIPRKSSSGSHYEAECVLERNKPRYIWKQELRWLSPGTIIYM